MEIKSDFMAIFSRVPHSFLNIGFIASLKL